MSTHNKTIIHPESWRVFGASEESVISVHGSEIIRYFLLPDSNRQVVETGKFLAKTTRNLLNSFEPHLIKADKSQLRMNVETLDFLKKIGTFFQKIQQTPDLILPLTQEENRSFITSLLSSMYNSTGSVRILFPVCPDYGVGESFHSTIGSGISAEAEAAIRAVTAFTEAGNELGLHMDLCILVADTETDHPDILKQCSPEGKEHYLEQCQQTKRAILQSLAEYSHATSVFTFTELFPQFHVMQYSFEEHFRQQALSDPRLLSVMQKTASSRSVRHAQILGHTEKNMELTIRYMSQYAALGEIARSENITAVANYPTPNLPYFHTSRGNQEQGNKAVLPVFQTRLIKNR